MVLILQILSVFAEESELKRFGLRRGILQQRSYCASSSNSPSKAASPVNRLPKSAAFLRQLHPLACRFSASRAKVDTIDG